MLKSHVKIPLFVASLFLLLSPQIVSAALPGARSSTVSGDVFLGGDYIELGISKYGSFGTDQNKPAGFFGTAARNNIGMSSDLDGFDTGTDWRMDFFMPGTQEERWSIGYKIGGVTTTAANARRANTTNITDNNVYDQSSGDLLKATSIGTHSANLETTQVISFNRGDKFFKNVVTLKNVSNENTLNEVRFMRSFDPDNTVDKGGGYGTRNSIVFTHAAGDGKAVVQADTSNSNIDPVYLGTGGADGGTRSPIFFYSSDSRARVNYHNGLNPGNVYTATVYDSTNPKGSAESRDGAISIAFDVGTLESGESETFIYYTSLDERDFSEVEAEIQEDEAQGAPTTVGEVETETTNTAVTIRWTTDILASSLIEYGLVPTYGFTTAETNTEPRVTEHEVSISNLKPCARYFYRTKSTNSDELAAYSEQKTFTTTGCAVSQVMSGVEERVESNATGSLSTTVANTAVSLQIPANVSNASRLFFQINTLDPANFASPSGKALLGSNVFELIAVDEEDNEVEEFLAPLTFTIDYSELDVAGFDPSTLDLYWYNSGTWEKQNCSHDQDLKTLTCSMEHFSTYAVMGTMPNTSQPGPSSNSSESSGPAAPTNPQCEVSGTLSAPNLFEIRRTGSTATLFFSPLMDTNEYFISYSTLSHAEEHGALVQLSSDGVQKFEVTQLNGQNNYYFKVRGNKGCLSGPWSQTQYSSVMTSALSSVGTSQQVTEEPDEESQPDADSESALETAPETTNSVSNLYDVRVKVVKSGKPVANTVVEIPELNKQATTDENGEILIEDVEQGKHTFRFVQQAFASERDITVEGQEKEFDVYVTLSESKWGWINWIPWILLTICVILLVLRKRKSDKKNS